MKMLERDIKAHPKFAAYLRNELPKVVNSAVLVRAMETIGQINKAQLIKALSPDHLPNLRVDFLIGKYGQFDHRVDSNTIKISWLLVRDFERGIFRKIAPDGVTPLVGVTVLHELVHWGDAQDGVDRPGEEGNEFEMAVYGELV